MEVSCGLLLFLALLAMNTTPGLDLKLLIPATASCSTLPLICCKPTPGSGSTESRVPGAGFP